MAEGLAPDAVKRPGEAPRARELVRGLETEALSEDEFGERFGELLELEDRTRLIERMFGGCARTSACWQPCARCAPPGFAPG